MTVQKFGVSIVTKANEDAIAFNKHYEILTKLKFANYV